MSSSPSDALAWAVQEMELHAAELRQLVDGNLCAPEPGNSMPDLTQLLLKIDDMATWLEQVALQCAEVVQRNTPPALDAHIIEEDKVVDAEMHTDRSPPTPRPLCELCEEWGVEYDSDQSRGV